jgi:gamma-glutamyltranspeptidase/glutathione hydrolase
VTDRRPLVPIPLARGCRGAVVAPHHLATAAGLSVLRAGGHAVDAAIATNAVLGVVDPGSCGIGGDAFWLIWDQSARRQLALNGSGRAPRGLDANRVRAAGHDAMPLFGPLTINVPGAVRSWGDAHRRFGRLSRDTVLGPAIELARGGFPASDEFVGSVERTASRALASSAPSDGFFSTYRPHARAWRAGEIVRLPALASTLEALARDGFDAFYDGELGARQAAGLAAAGSPMTAEDLAAHRSDWGDAISVEYRGVRVTSHPPNSSGVVALELLSILGQFAAPGPGGTAFGPAGVTDPDWVHLGVEAAKLAMADRDAHLTDPAFRDVPVDLLLSDAHARERVAQITPGRASTPAASRNPSGGGTIFLAAVDAEGNAVSLIESNYMGFGSGVVDPETGVHYHNRGSYFSLDPSHPNALEPGKRTLHTLLPGMLFRAGRPEPWIVVGSMGGDAQPQVHAQFVSAVVDGGLDIGTAVAAPRWFVEPETHFAPPVLVRLESRHREAVRDALAAMGHPVAWDPPFDSNFGHQHAIELVDGGPAAGGSLAATTDPRSEGLPAVW